MTAPVSVHSSRPVRCVFQRRQIARRGAPSGTPIRLSFLKKETKTNFQFSAPSYAMLLTGQKPTGWRILQHSADEKQYRCCQPWPANSNQVELSGPNCLTHAGHVWWAPNGASRLFRFSLPHSRIISTLLFKSSEMCLATLKRIQICHCQVRGQPTKRRPPVASQETNASTWPSSRVY